MTSNSQADCEEMCELFEVLRRTCRGGGGPAIKGELGSEFERQGISITFREASSVAYIKPDGYPEAVFKRLVGVYFGNSCVYRWEDEYSGYYRGIGAGWSQDLERTTFKDDVSDLFQALGVKPPEVHVPPPQSHEEETDLER